MFSKKNKQMQTGYDTLQTASNVKAAFPTTFDPIKKVSLQEVLLKQASTID
ncbi:hypothetical protein QNI19_35600 [Cytophagaceae bacterium DM2B3-1]|uniref:Uncharacterized protein n=1 Tax=Xanthocytophaga flava TaxID=3048013 RepID=A0ABT7CX21_9BACT|nr:hypothetical protein [Xanthocytophaga flavus]MDJ1498314.1 hypothetical protein [Xanthocytophaga flavus]